MLCGAAAAQAGVGAGCGRRAPPSCPTTAELRLPGSSGRWLEALEADWSSAPSSAAAPASASSRWSCSTSRCSSAPIHFSRRSCPASYRPASCCCCAAACASASALDADPATPGAAGAAWALAAAWARATSSARLGAARVSSGGAAARARSVAVARAWPRGCRSSACRRCSACRRSMRPRWRACIRVAALSRPLSPPSSRVRVLAPRASGGACAA